jgi:para-aminobenzoate N-oxygenase AurF
MILSRIPQDSTVIRGVRLYVGEHAKDEGRHHAYFSDLLRHVWPRLSPRQQDVIGPLLPVFIKWFLQPDFGPFERFLAVKDFTPKQIECVYEDSYRPLSVTHDIRVNAKHTLRHFEAVGVFDNRRTVGAFDEHGFGGEISAEGIAS